MEATLTEIFGNIENPQQLVGLLAGGIFWATLWGIRSLFKLQRTKELSELAVSILNALERVEDWFFASPKPGSASTKYDGIMHRKSELLLELWGCWKGKFRNGALGTGEDAYGKLLTRSERKKILKKGREVYYNIEKKRADERAKYLVSKLNTNKTTV